MILNRLESRRVDQIAISEFGIPGVVLMENAGRGCVDYLNAQKVNGPVLIVCGSGNNGGDGFVIARHLENQGIPTQLLLLAEADSISGDARVNYNIAARMNIPLSIGKDIQTFAATSDWSIDEFEWIVDAVYGTGGRVPLPQRISNWMQVFNATSAKRLAIDIPTGLECDTGEVDAKVFDADATCTFVSQKPCMQTPAGKKVCGSIRVVDIGVPEAAIDSAQSPSQAQSPANPI